MVHWKMVAMWLVSLMTSSWERTVLGCLVLVSPAERLFVSTVEAPSLTEQGIAPWSPLQNLPGLGLLDQVAEAGRS